VVRGGSWNNNQRNARPSVRNRNNPDNSNDNIGFRLVSHILLFPSRQCHGSFTRCGAEAKWRDLSLAGVPYERRANIETPCRLW